jgi:hypothetical protein
MEFVGQLLNDLLVLFKGDLASLLVTIVIVVVGVAATFALAAFRKSDLYQANKDKLDLLAEYAANWIFLAEFGDVDLTEYEAKRAERVEAGLPDVDARMLFVIDQLGKQANERFGLTLNPLELLALAERKYQELLNDVNSPIGMQ